MPTDALLQEWMLWQLAARRSEVTVTERVRVLAQFSAESSTGAFTASPVDVIKWMSKHQTDWSTSTAATYHSYLRAWYAWLAIMDYRSDNPMLKIASPKYPARTPRPVPDDDLVRLLTIRMHHRTRVMILLAALAGLRVSEVSRVRGEDIDIRHPRIFVIGKGDSRDWLPFHPLLVDAALTMPSKGWWFPSNSRNPDGHVRAKGVSAIIGNAMRRAKVRGTPHGLRHWMGTALLEDGADLRTIQELLRHKNLNTAAIYTMVSDDRRTAAVNRLDPFRGVA